MIMETKIYGLVDPLTSELRYVGKTVQPLAERLYRHLSCRELTHSACWVRGLAKKGLRPVIFEIETVTGDWQEAERHWIAYFRFLGARLLNMTAGGAGLQALRHSEKTRALLSEKTHGKGVPEERRLRISESLRGKSIPEDVRAKISQALKGKPKPPRSPEHARKIGACNIGRARTAEQKAATSEKLKAYAATPEGKAKLRAAANARHERVS